MDKLLRHLPAAMGWFFLTLNALAMLGLGDSFVLVNGDGVYFSWVIGK